MPGKLLVEIYKKMDNDKTVASSSPVEPVKTDTKASIKNASSQSTAKQIMVYKVVTEVADQAKRIAISTGNRYFNLSEDYMAQNDMVLINAYMGRAKTLAMDLYSGAKIGAMVGGPVGAVVGLIGGAVTYGVDRAIQIRERQSSWYSQLNSTNAQTGWEQARMGLIDNGRGTEN